MQKYNIFKALNLIIIISLSFVLFSKLTIQTTKAAMPSASLYFQPNSSSLPQNANIKLMLDAKTNNISFVQVKLNFDKTKVNVASDITTTTKLSTTNKLSTPSEANSSGQILISLGLTPADWSNPPTGVFEIATIPFKSMTSTANQTTPLSFVDADIQIVAILGPSSFDYAPFSSSPASLTLNPSGNPTPTPTVTPTTAPTYTPTPTPTPTNQCLQCMFISSNSWTPLLHSLGNANCDNKIDINDYYIWRKSYLNYSSTKDIINNKEADFDCDNKITYNDFRIYIINRIKFILHLLK
jgi:hypothetical protein